MSASFSKIAAELVDEYQQSHSIPWVIGYSGGKDSTLVVHLVLDMLLRLPQSERTRPVWIIGNDTQVESPLIVGHLIQSLKRIQSACLAWRLPVKTQLTQPEATKNFWVNLIGRGYPPPTRTFRWCTDRLKIQPTAKFVAERVKENGEVILLLGVRRSESSNRARTIKRYEGDGRLSRHNDIHACYIYKPIVDLDVDDVWEFLATHKPIWGENHSELIRLYRDSAGGECPVVTSQDDAPSCGSRSPRFGCWTCTVVQKDKSLDGFIESGHEKFRHLSEFRDWLIEIRDKPENRLHRRRGNKVQFTKYGNLIMGPFTFKARKMILERLLDVQIAYGRQLISSQEIQIIYDLWMTDLQTENAL